MGMQYKKLFIALSFSLSTVALILCLNYSYIPQRAEEIMQYPGEASERAKIQERFWAEMKSRESYAKDDVLEIAGAYDVKISEYFVKVTYKNEPDTIYTYYKDGNGGFSLMHILKDGKPIDRTAEELKNEHVFAPS